jgi:RNA polymerase sigma factor (TIGR02999 family)
MSEITLLLQQARDGDGEAWNQAVALVYQDLRGVAQNVLGPRSGERTLDITSLVNECYLRMERKGALALENRQHLLAVAARAMRQLLINHARDRATQKREGRLHQTTLSAADAQSADLEAEHWISLDKALHVLGSEDEVAVRVVECRVFAGMTDEEGAAALNLTLRTFQRVYSDAKLRLAQLLAD